MQNTFQEAETTMEYENPNADMYIGICWCVADMGMQETTWQGVTKMKRKIKIGIELHGDGSLMSDERHFSVFSTQTLSLNPKANLPGMLEGWTGQPIPVDGGNRTFDFYSLIGKPCMVQVIHTPKEGGGVWVNCGAVTPVYKGMEIPEMTNESVFFMLAGHTEDDFLKLPEWMQGKVNRDGFMPKPF